jgi:hypothetical protein
VQLACDPDLGAETLLANIAPVARTERARRSLTVVLEDVDRLSPPVQRELRRWVELAAPPAIAHSAWVRWIATVSESPDEPAASLDPGLRQALAAIPIALPALRETPERIPALVEDVAREFSESTGSRPRHFSSGALGVLQQYPWPGNLRELEAVVLRTLAACSGEMIHTADLRFDTEPPAGLPAGLPAAPPAAPVREPVEAAPEREPVASAPISPELETWRLMQESEPAPAERAPSPPPARRGLASPAELVGDATLRRFLTALSRELDASVGPHATPNLPPERFADPELQARFSELVQVEPQRVDEVLSRLARFAGLGPPVRGALDLSALFDDLIEAQRPDLEARQILLLRELERAQPRVLGDAAQLHFALDRLLREALQLVKARGDLYLASRYHPHGLRGAPSIRALLRFQATARVAPVASAEAAPLSEHALDLLLVEAVVRAHGGRFTLDANEGAETVILIDLPAPATELG